MRRARSTSVARHGDRLGMGGCSPAFIALLLAACAGRAWAGGAVPCVAVFGSADGSVTEFVNYAAREFQLALREGVISGDEVEGAAAAISFARLAGGPASRLASATAARPWSLSGPDGADVVRRQVFREMLYEVLWPALASVAFDATERAEVLVQLERALLDLARVHRENASTARTEAARVRKLSERISIGGDGVEYPWTRVTDPDLVSRLGEAWRDPSGMIWGDLVRRPTNPAQPLRMDWDDAERYCKERGLTLPSFDDYVRLRGYFGGTSDSLKGYRPQILRDFGITSYWTSTGSTSRMVVNGADGTAGFGDSTGNWTSVRCVKAP